MRFIGIAFLITLASVAVMSQGGMRPAADFSALTMTGATVGLNEMKGKVVVLTFWSTRCGICHSEIPKLNRLATQYAGKDVVFLAATTENEDKVNAYLKRNPFGFDILPNSFGLLLKYANRDRHGNVGMGYPAYFVIDRNGRIEMSAMGWDHISKVDSTINKLLALP